MSNIPDSKIDRSRFLTAVARLFGTLTSVFDQGQYWRELAQAQAVADPAVEHILCPPCQEATNVSQYLQDASKTVEIPRSWITEDFRSYADRMAVEFSAADGCHLCSLVLAMVRNRETPIAGAIHVELRVSRSGSMNLVIKAGESKDQTLGELIIVPADYSDDHTESKNHVFSFPDPGLSRNAQLAKSLSASGSFALAKEWLQQCLQNHSKCRAAAGAATQAPRPKRLVEIRPGKRVRVRVVRTKDLVNPEFEYLTLSHCWGGADILKLLVENARKLQVRIPFSKLPATFQHAIIITHRLGYAARC